MNEQVRHEPIAKEEEIDLRKYLEVIKKRKVTIFLIFFVACLSSGIYTLAVPKIYEASSLLAVLGAVTTDEKGQIQKFSQPTDFYVNLAKSEQLAYKVIKELKLDQPPNNLTPAELISAIKVETRSGSPSLKITAQANSPKKARDIANTLAKKVIEINHEMLDIETGITEDFFSRQVKIAEGELRKNENILLKFSKENNLEVLRQKVSNALNLRGQFELEYNNLLAQIEVTEGELKEVTKSFQNEERTYKLTRSIVEDPAHQQIIAKAGGKEFLDLMELRIETELINPIYESLRARFVNTTISLATLRLNKNVLEERMKKNEAELNTLRLELASKETELSRLIRERDLAKERLYSLTKRETLKKTLGEAIIGRVSIAAQAIEPTEPSGPSVIKNILIAGFLGLFFGIFLVFFQEYLSKESVVNK